MIINIMKKYRQICKKTSSIIIINNKSAKMNNYITNGIYSDFKYQLENTPPPFDSLKHYK